LGSAVGVDEERVDGLTVWFIRESRLLERLRQQALYLVDLCEQLLERAARLRSVRTVGPRSPALCATSLPTNPQLDHLRGALLARQRRRLDRPDQVQAVHPGPLSVVRARPAARSRSEHAAGEVRDELRRRRVETDDVELARIVWIRDRE